MVDGSLEPTKYDVSKTWWAREDSNLQPDRYERSALTVELRARASKATRPNTMLARARQFHGVALPRRRWGHGYRPQGDAGALNPTSEIAAWRCRSGSWPCPRRTAARFPSIAPPACWRRTANPPRTGCGLCPFPSRSTIAPDWRSCRWSAERLAETQGLRAGAASA